MSGHGYLVAHREDPLIRHQPDLTTGEFEPLRLRRELPCEGQPLPRGAPPQTALRH